MRNSSLVKCPSADNVTGLKHSTEAMGACHEACAVGERSQCIEAVGVSRGGALGSENPGMSNERRVKNPSAESLRVPG